MRFVRERHCTAWRFGGRGPAADATLLLALVSSTTCPVAAFPPFRNIATPVSLHTAACTFLARRSLRSSLSALDGSASMSRPVQLKQRSSARLRARCAPHRAARAAARRRCPAGWRHVLVSHRAARTCWRRFCRRARRARRMCPAGRQRHAAALEPAAAPHRTGSHCNATSTPSSRTIPGYRRPLRG